MSQPLQAISHFPVIPDISASNAYEEVMDTARKEYKEYFDVFTVKAGEIDDKAREWTARHTALACKSVPTPSKQDLENEFWEKIDAYIVYQHVRNDTKRIIDVYDSVIASCTPPLLDVNTLSLLQKLKVKITDLKANYDQTFTTHLNELKEQRQRLQVLYEKVVPSLVKLRYALEPLGKFIYTQFPEWGPKNIKSYLEKTPYVNWGSPFRKATHALTRKPKDQASPQEPLVASLPQQKVDAQPATEATPAVQKPAASAAAALAAMNQSQLIAPPQQSPLVSYARVVSGPPRQT